MRFPVPNGFYELNPFPGCNQLVVANHVFTDKEVRNQGFGQKSHRLRLLTATELGYDAMICTVRADNDVECHILKKNNWSQLFEFTNRETGARVQIWARQLAGVSEGSQP